MKDTEFIYMKGLLQDGRDLRRELAPERRFIELNTMPYPAESIRLQNSDMIEAIKNGKMNMNDLITLLEENKIEMRILYEEYANMEEQVCNNGNSLIKMNKRIKEERYSITEISIRANIRRYSQEQDISLKRV